MPALTRLRWSASGEPSRSTSAARLLVPMAAGILIVAVVWISRGAEAGVGTKISGDPRVVRLFAGRWYDRDEKLAVTVVAGSSPWLEVAVPPGYRVSAARTVGGEIHCLVEAPGLSSWMSLRLLDHDILAVVPPGGGVSSCWSCTPRFRRFSIARFAARKAEKASQLAESAWAAIERWLVDVTT